MSPSDALAVGAVSGMGSHPLAVGGGSRGAGQQGQLGQQQRSLASNEASSGAPDGSWDPPDATATLEDLQPDVLYHVLRACRQQDVAHLKMCSRRLLCNILVACQHWAPKVESWLAADPSSAGLLHQLRSTGGRQLQPPAPQDTSARSTRLPLEEQCSSKPKSHALKQLPAACSLDEAEALQGSIPAARRGVVGTAVGADDSSCSLATVGKIPQGIKDRFDWRQVWSCLERAQAGPWQLDARRLTPTAFPHGVLLTFELLFQHPAPATEPGEQQCSGWRDSATVLSFTLDGKTVEITVDANGKVTSPQHEWYQGSIKLEPGQPKLLALEISYLFPVAAWYLHPCTLAAPKLPAAGSSNSLASSGSSSCASSMSTSTAQDANWDSYSLTASSFSSGMSIAHSAALCSAVSSLSTGSMRDSFTRGSSSSAGSIGRPRLCLDLSHGVGSYVSDPRYIDEATRSRKPRGIERLELAGRVCWKPKPMLSWLNRLLPAGIRSHHGCGSSSAGSGGTGSLTSSGTGSAGPGGGTCCGSGGASGAGVPLGVKKESSRPVCAVSVSKAAVWQVPEDPEYRFDQGFAFWAVQHKAEQLLEHYGVLPPWQG